MMRALPAIRASPVIYHLSFIIYHLEAPARRRALRLVSVRAGVGRTIVGRRAAAAAAGVAFDALPVVAEEGADGHEGTQALDELVGLRILDGVDDDHVAELQRAAVGEGLAAEVVELGGVGLEADVDGLDHLAWRYACHLGLGDALLGLGRGFEDAQSVEFHGHAHGQQLGQALRHLGEDGLDVLESVLAAMVDHVLCEATGAEGLQAVDHGIIPTVPGRGLVGVLSEVDSHNGIVN